MLSAERSQEAAVPSPALNMEHGFLRKIQGILIQRRNQFKEETLKRTETAKLAQVGLSNKSAKPTIEIYRPSDLPQSSEDVAQSNSHPQQHYQHHQPHHHSHHQAALMKGTNEVAVPQQAMTAGAVHFQVPPVVLSSNESPLVVGRSSPRPSKSFSQDEIAPYNAAFPAQYQRLIKMALHDPNALSAHQVTLLVRTICHKATEGIQNVEPMAQLCLTIIAKERNETVLESLLSACREWFSERDRLLRPLEKSSGVPRRWTAYVCFLAELLLGLRCCSAAASAASATSATAGRTAGSSGTAPTASRTLCLVMLLCDCCHIILRPPSLGNPGEMECLQSVLNLAGWAVERDAPQRMAELVEWMRQAFVQRGLSAQARKTLLELIELRASGWQLNLAQQLYYFSRTSLEHRK